jgi:hypothetical protein
MRAPSQRESSGIPCSAGSPKMRREGIALLVTLVVLVALSSLAYDLSSRMGQHVARQEYMIDYQKARYACDSALKYAMTTIEDVTPRLVERPNEPDFSDLFAMRPDEYEQMLAIWAADAGLAVRDFNDVNIPSGLPFGPNDPFGGADFNETVRGLPPADFNEPAGLPLTVRGPYGPPWPLVDEPVEFEIGSARVTIRVEDENAKYPLCWAILEDKDQRREAEAGFETFFEWMGIEPEKVEELRLQLEDVRQIKPFGTETEKSRRPKRDRPRRGRRSRRTSRSRRTARPPSATESTSDFAKLFHSSLIDTELLERPVEAGPLGPESAVRYVSLWGAAKVNINTAPRCVLEAAFTFGGDAAEISDEIIRRRRQKAFASVDELKESFLRYSDSITRAEKYLVTASDFFTVKVTAVSKTASVSAVMAVKRSEKKTETIGVMMY